MDTSFAVAQHYNLSTSQVCLYPRKQSAATEQIITSLSHLFVFMFSLISLRVQVGSKTDCVMCFGPTVPDGYGVCYNPMDEHINIAITAFNSCEETNAAKFAQAIEDALLDMRALLEDTATADH